MFNVVILFSFVQNMSYAILYPSQNPRTMLYVLLYYGSIVQYYFVEDVSCTRRSTKKTLYYSILYYICLSYLERELYNATSVKVQKKLCIKTFALYFLYLVLEH